MLSFTANDTTFYEACRTALELIEEISSIPLEYMRAMGLAMVYMSPFTHHPTIYSYLDTGIIRSRSHPE